MSGWTMEITPTVFTVADAYDYWATLLFYGYDYDGIPADPTECQAAAIGWASRDQREVIPARHDMM